MQHDTEGLHRLSESSGPGYALRAKWILPTAVAPDLFRRNSGAYSREVIEQLRAQLTERDLVVRRRLRLRAVAACVSASRLDQVKQAADFGIGLMARLEEERVDLTPTLPRAER